MERPEKIYLDEPIHIKGIKIGHTHAGLKYMIEHYQHILDTATRTQLADKERQYMGKMITNLQQHLELYESQSENKPLAK